MQILFAVRLCVLCLAIVFLVSGAAELHSIPGAHDYVLLLVSGAAELHSRPGAHGEDRDVHGAESALSIPVPRAARYEESAQVTCETKKVHRQDLNKVCR